MPALTPVPNTPLRDDPTQDDIWKRWLSQLRTNVSPFGGFASGSVIFANALGVPTFDSNFTYNSTTDVLTVNGSTFGLNTQVGGTLGVTGNTTLTGDLAVNGGDLTSTATTFNLVNATATTVNFARAATTLSIGASTGTLTVNNTTLAARAGTYSTTLSVTGAATLSTNGVSTTIIGAATSQSIGGTNFNLQSHSTSSDAGFGSVRWRNLSAGAHIRLGASRGAAIGTNVIVQNNDVLGSIAGWGANGSDFTIAARIIFEVDGTPGATNDMPGRIVFGTTPDGSGTLIERLRIDSAGNVGIGTTGALSELSINGGLHVGGDSDAGDNNALIDGTLTATGAFGCNAATAQTAYASGGALAAYVGGANGLDTGANMSALHALVVNIRAALVANGIMS